MKSGIRLLEASGASFTMLDEWEHQSKALMTGVVPSGKDDEWAGRLARASTRQACRKCSLREAGSNCILGKDIVDRVSKVFCLPITRGDREYGLVNFFFLAPVTIIESKRRNLNFLSEHAKLALENHYQMRHGAAALSHLESSRAKKDFKSSVSNITDAIKSGLNIKSVLLWSPPGNEYDIAAMLLYSVSTDKDELGAFGNDDLAVELWQDILKTGRPILRDFDDEQGKSVRLLVVPIEGTTKSPIGMMVCVYDSSNRNLSDHMPAFKLAAQSISTILQSIQLVDQMEYRAARDERIRLARGGSRWLGADPRLFKNPNRTNAQLS